MPYRPDLSTPPEYNHLYDRFGGFHDDRAQMRDTQPRGGQDEDWWHDVRCGTCGRDLIAQPLCPACGDPEEMAA